MLQYQFARLYNLFLNKMFMRKGFTLIECMVALFLSAIVIASAVRSIHIITSDVHDAFVLEVATWIAENEYNQFLINGDYPDVGVYEKKVTNAGIDFNIKETVSETQNPYFRKITLSIKENKKKEYIFNTINFLSKY
jgi:general secretion pathway protein I